MKEVSDITVRIYRYLFLPSLFPSLNLFTYSWLGLRDPASAHTCLHNASSTLEVAYSSPRAIARVKKQKKEKEQASGLLLPVRTGVESWSHGSCHTRPGWVWWILLSGVAASIGPTAFLPHALTPSLPLWDGLERYWYQLFEQHRLSFTGKDAGTLGPIVNGTTTSHKAVLLLNAAISLLTQCILSPIMAVVDRQIL